MTRSPPNWRRRWIGSTRRWGTARDLGKNWSVQPVQRGSAMPHSGARGQLGVRIARRGYGAEMRAWWSLDESESDVGDPRATSDDASGRSSDVASDRVRPMLLKSSSAAQPELMSSTDADDRLCLWLPSPEEGGGPETGGALEGCQRVFMVRFALGPYWPINRRGLWLPSLLGEGLGERAGRLRHHSLRCYNADKTRWPTPLVPPPF
jgi:hypothetical protein